MKVLCLQVKYKGVREESVESPADFPNSFFRDIG